MDIDVLIELPELMINRNMRCIEMEEILRKLANIS